MIGTLVVPPQRRIAEAAAMLVEKPRAAFGVAARRHGPGSTRTSTRPVARHAEQPEAQETAQLAHARIVLAARSPRRHPHRQPDLVAGGGAIDALQHQFEVEREFQFADDDDRRLIAAQRHQIAAADFALHGKPSDSRKRFTGA